MKRIVIQIMLYTVACCMSSAVVAAGNVEAGKTKSAACIGCHMADGNSVMPEWPKIAGQLPSYLVGQLLDFKSGRRINAVMDPMVKPLSKQDIEDIAAYYASQTIQPGVAKPEKMAAGEKLYKKGVFYTPLTACIGCHGMDGQGNRTWKEVMTVQPVVLTPGIGGQHVNYIITQLKAFRSGERNNDTGAVMRNIAKQMNDEQIEAVAEYITQLR